MIIEFVSAFIGFAVGDYIIDIISGDKKEKEKMKEKIRKLEYENAYLSTTYKFDIANLTNQYELLKVKINLLEQDITTLEEESMET